MSAHAALTKREREIMDVLYRLGRATAAEVLAGLAGSPHYSTVRTQLRVLEEKGHVRHESDGLRCVISSRPSSTARPRAPSPRCWVATPAASATTTWSASTRSCDRPARR